MKLQKLVYFTHGWWLALNSFSLMDERPEVWRHGPVFSSLYHVMKEFGHLPIYRPQARFPNLAPELITGSNVAPGYVDFVWERYGHLSSFALSDLTHKAGTPWSRLAAEYRYTVPPGLEIPDEYVRDEFRKIYHEEYANSGEATTV